MELNKTSVVLVLTGLVFGLFWWIVIRSLFFFPEPIHYHANFAVYIDGQREEFSSPVYYEDTLACTQDDAQNPRGRAHLHQPQNDVVHVHDSAVTWGNFFENIGWSLGNTFMKTDTDILAANDSAELNFILNGEPTRLVAEKVISSTDRLLISYGTESDAELADLYDAITANAAEFNTLPDPASCSGQSDPSFWERLRFGLLG